MEVTNIYFEKVSDNQKKGDIEYENIQLPYKSTKKAIAYDFFSPVAVTIQPKTSVLIWTNVKARFSEDIALIINVRSSMGKNNIMLANTQGWIDSDYYNNETNEGNIGINLYNLSDKPYPIFVGDRIAQGMFVKVYSAENEECNGKEERKGGFGSTNKIPKKSINVYL